METQKLYFLIKISQNLISNCILTCAELLRYLFINTKASIEVLPIASGLENMSPTDAEGHYLGSYILSVFISISQLPSHNF